MDRLNKGSMNSNGTTTQPNEGASEMDGYKVDEMVTSMFQPDTLIGSEYLETQRRSHQLDPEHSLILAVLEDALSCFKDNINAQNKKKKQQCQEAEAWIFNREAESYFSFEYICEVLGLDPGYIQKHLKQWKEMKLKELEAEDDNHPLVRWAENISRPRSPYRGFDHKSEALHSEPKPLLTGKSLASIV